MPPFRGRMNGPSNKVWLISLGLAGLLVFLPLRDGGMSFQAKTALTSIVAILFLAFLLIEPHRLYFNRPSLKLIIPPVLVFLITTWNSVYLDLSIKEALLLLGYFLAAYMGYAIAMEGWGRKTLFLALIISGLTTSLVAYYIFFTSRPGSMARSALMGTFQYQNGLAGFILLIVFLPLAFLLSSEKPIETWAYGGVATLLMTALLMTNSRGGLISFMGGLIAWLFLERKALWKRRLRLTGLVLAIIALFLLLSHEGLFSGPSRVASLAKAASPETPDTSFRWRQHIYRWTLGIIQDNPFLGTGPGTFPLVLGLYQKVPYVSGLYAHNHYLQTGAETGMVGFSILLILLGYLFWRGIKAIRLMSDVQCHPKIDIEKYNPQKLPSPTPSTSSPTCGGGEVGGKGEREIGNVNVYFSMSDVSGASPERGKAIGLFSGLLASALHAGVDFDWSYPAISLVLFIEWALLLSYGNPFQSPKSNVQSPKSFKALFFILCPLILLASLSRLYADSILLWGRWDLEKGKLEKAVKELEASVLLNPFRSSARYWLALAHAKSGKGEKAIRQAQKDLRLNPLDGNAHNGAGKVYWTLGRTKEAERELLEAVRLNPYSRLSFYADIVDFYISQKREGEALSWIEKASSIFTPGLVKGPEARTLIPGDRYTLGRLFLIKAQIFQGKGEPLEAEKARALGLELSRPDTREIFPRGFKNEFASPEATLITFWNARIKGDRELLKASLAKGQKGEIGPDLVAPFSPPVEALEVSRILSLAVSEGEAIMEYELTLFLKGGLVRQTINRATFIAEKDGWRLEL